MPVNFDIRLLPEDLPIADYDVDWAPEGFESGGVYLCLILSSESGKRYQGARGYNDVNFGESKMYLFNRLDLGSLGGHAPRTFTEIIPTGTIEQFTKATADGKIVVETPTSRYENDGREWRWRDFNGLMDLTVRNVGKPYFVSLPKQLDFNSAQKHRGDIGYVEGMLDGERVWGMGIISSTFSEKGSGLKLIDLPFMNKVNHGWMIWMAEFEDGEIVAGEGRRGKPGTGWQMMHLYYKGESRLIENPIIEMTHAPSGPVNSFTLDLDGFRVESATDCCSVWPYAAFGEITATSDGRRIKRSWTNFEWYPKNMDVVLKALMDKSLTPERIEQATIIDERIIVPGLIE